MDPTKFVPPAPTTTDPITWIAFLLVVVLVAVLLWQLRAGEQERRQESQNRDASLAAFRAELAAQRDHDAAQVASTHQRIDGLSGEVRELGQIVASQRAPKS